VADKTTEIMKTTKRSIYCIIGLFLFIMLFVALRQNYIIWRLSLLLCLFWF